MTNWMKRRIERSRSRCEKKTTECKPDKARVAEAKQQTDERAAPLSTQTATR
jgi:hypothetical protein